MKKIVSLALALMLVAVAACASATTVGICQLVQHVALDQRCNGLRVRLTESAHDDAHAQPTSAPSSMSPSTVSRRSVPFSSSAAASSMPSETMPLSLAGFRFATRITVLPTISSGE